METFSKDPRRTETSKDWEVKCKWEPETQLRAANRKKIEYEMRGERGGRVDERVWNERGGGGRQQWNPVDEVTYMPRVIRRLCLLYLCELWLWPPCSPSHILPAIYSTTHHNNRSMSSTCDRAARCVKTRISTSPPQLPAPHFLFKLHTGWEKICMNCLCGKLEVLKRTAGGQRVFNSFTNIRSSIKMWRTNHIDMVRGWECYTVWSETVLFFLDT